VPIKTNVQGMSWAEFRQFFAKAWRPGEHVGLCAGTGAGKSTFAAGILNLRQYVLIGDPKGGDDLISSLGWPRLPDWPGERGMIRILDEDERKGRASRYLVGPVVGRGSELPRLRKAIAESLDGAFDMGGWTYYLDEAQVAADRRLLNLSGQIDKLLVAARSKGVSMVLSFQQPKWVTSASLTQPTWFAVSQTRDRDTVHRLSELMGRDRAELRGAINGLVKYSWLIVGRDPNEPMIVTVPDEIKKRRTT
jgi:hypothetical protein